MDGKTLLQIFLYLLALMLYIDGWRATTLGVATVKLTDEIRSAIRDAVYACDGISHLSRESGVSQPCLSRYLGGGTEYATQANWEKLYPHIKAYLKPAAATGIPSLKVYDVSGELIGVWPVMRGWVELCVLIEEELFIGPDLRENSIIGLGPVASSFTRGELVCTASPPYIVGRWGVSNLPPGRYRSILTVIAFMKENPRQLISDSAKK